MRYDLAYVAIGAVLGAVLRYSITDKPLFWGDLPLSVLIVNVLGSLALGIAMAAAQEFGFGGGYVLLVGVGFCGSFTTMSSFAFETANLIGSGSVYAAVADMGLNVGASIASIFAGRAIVIALVGGG
jgi:fluoride exporter